MNPNGAALLPASNDKDSPRSVSANPALSNLSENGPGPVFDSRHRSGYDLPTNGADVFQSVGAARGAERYFDREPGRDGADSFGVCARARSCRRASLSGRSAAFSSRGDGWLRGDRERHFRREPKSTGLLEARRRGGDGQGSGATVDFRHCDADLYGRNDAA